MLPSSRIPMKVNFSNVLNTNPNNKVCFHTPTLVPETGPGIRRTQREVRIIIDMKPLRSNNKASADNFTVYRSKGPLEIDFFGN